MHYQICPPHCCCTLWGLPGSSPEHTGEALAKQAGRRGLRPTISRVFPQFRNFPHFPAIVFANRLAFEGAFLDFPAIFWWLFGAIFLTAWPRFQAPVQIGWRHPPPSWGLARDPRPPLQNKSIPPSFIGGCRRTRSAVLWQVDGTRRSSESSLNSSQNGSSQTLAGPADQAVAPQDPPAAAGPEPAGASPGPDEASAAGAIQRNYRAHLARGQAEQLRQAKYERMQEIWRQERAEPTPPQSSQQPVSGMADLD